ncbi:MAG: polymer-forming cytoskeletal protein [Lachnospiraceae bacterium]|jgi:cytoskeletal protein CcmA (bactofilin family)|nr:polymer-forming cytoskeletal protein [Lachnospiraceae bacterium]
MFKSKKKLDTVNTSIINTIIGNNSKIEGVLYASDSTRVDGVLQGKILSESSVIVGESGIVRGDIQAMEILVAGTVYGNLTAEQRIELTETGCVLGDLITKTLVIDEGASFKGNCMMEVMEDRKAPENFSADFHGKASPGQEKVKKEAKGKEGPKEVNEVEKI